MDLPSWRVEGMVVDRHEVRRSGKRGGGPCEYIVRLLTDVGMFEITTRNKESFERMGEEKCVKVEGLVIREGGQLRMQLERIISEC